jgi:hypothetical protein
MIIILDLKMCRYRMVRKDTDNGGILPKIGEGQIH